MEDIQILIVDDEPDIRQLLRILLKNQGYQISEAASGDEAVQRLRDFAGFDLVIMDIMMPGMDGTRPSAAFPPPRFCSSPPRPSWGTWPRPTPAAAMTFSPSPSPRRSFF